eukprot:362672-Chlamydomonas_euryale.AAC.3
MQGRPGYGRCLASEVSNFKFVGWARCRAGRGTDAACQWQCVGYGKAGARQGRCEAGQVLSRSGSAQLWLGQGTARQRWAGQGRANRLGPTQGCSWHCKAEHWALHNQPEALASPLVACTGRGLRHWISAARLHWKGPEPLAPPLVACTAWGPSHWHLRWSPSLEGA